jgi:hypothetical protein
MLFMRIADVHHFLGYDYLTGQHLGSRPLTMVSAFSHQQMCALLLASRKAKELVKSLDQGTMGTARWERVTGNHGESQMRVCLFRLARSAIMTRRRGRHHTPL